MSETYLLDLTELFACTANCYELKYPQCNTSCIFMRIPVNDDVWTRLFFMGSGSVSENSHICVNLKWLQSSCLSWTGRSWKIDFIPQESLFPG